jgi:hypothetical protein
MISPLQRPIRVATNPDQARDRRDVRNGWEETNGAVTFLDKSHLEDWS